MSIDELVSKAKHIPKGIIDYHIQNPGKMALFHAVRLNLALGLAKLRKKKKKEKQNV